MSSAHTIKKLLRENARLREENAVLRRENADLRRENAELRAQVQALLKRVADLEERLGQNSSNTSRPPSTDPPQAPRRRKKPSGRKPGGQPGHQGAQHTLLPPDRVDHVQDVRPTACRNCHRLLQGEDPRPLRHQHLEIPPLRPIVHETRLHTLVCEHCLTRTRAPLPPGVPAGLCGPRLQAIVAMCTGVYRLSKRTTQELLSDLFGVVLSLGALDRHEKIAGDALEAPYQEARQALPGATQAHADETGWREARKKAWLWVVATSTVVVFMIHPSRGAEAARRLLEGFLGYLVSDRWGGYNFWPLGLRQICWAHYLESAIIWSVGPGAANLAVLRGSISG